MLWLLVGCLSTLLACGGGEPDSSSSAESSSTIEPTPTTVAPTSTTVAPTSSTEPESPEDRLLAFYPVACENIVQDIQNVEACTFDSDSLHFEVTLTPSLSDSAELQDFAAWITVEGFAVLWEVPEDPDVDNPLIQRDGSLTVHQGERTWACDWILMSTLAAGVADFANFQQDCAT